MRHRVLLGAFEGSFHKATRILVFSVERSRVQGFRSYGFQGRVKAFSGFKVEGSRA